MIEADSEATEVWNHPARIALFLSGMRHFANEAHRRKWPCTYFRLDDESLPADFAEPLVHALHSLKPQALVVLEAGAWRMERLVEERPPKRPGAPALGGRHPLFVQSP
jgi:deoxyribodipyrimidine photolyase-related protein